MPKSIEVREVKVQVEQPGFRTESLVVVTTLIDAEAKTVTVSESNSVTTRWFSE